MDPYGTTGKVTQPLIKDERAYKRIFIKHTKNNYKNQTVSQISKGLLCEDRNTSDQQENQNVWRICTNIL